MKSRRILTYMVHQCFCLWPTPLAGASQHHKHLQLVPLPLGEDGADVPISTVLQNDIVDATQPGLKFKHRFCWLTAQHWEQPKVVFLIPCRLMLA